MSRHDALLALTMPDPSNCVLSSYPTCPRLFSRRSDTSVHNSGTDFPPHHFNYALSPTLLVSVDTLLPMVLFFAQENNHTSTTSHHDVKCRKTTHTPHRRAANVQSRTDPRSFPLTKCPHSASVAPKRISRGGNTPISPKNVPVFEDTRRDPQCHLRVLYHQR